MTTNFRALCAELLADYEEHLYRSVLADKARAALAEPQPKPPTVMEIIELADEIEAAGLGEVDLVRAALARWGNYPGSPDSSPQPIPVSELPEPPTDDELDELFTEIDQSGEPESWRAYARAVLVRWGA